MKSEVIRSKNFVEDAANLIESAANEAISQRGLFGMALSGGNTPRPIYAELAARKIDWSKVLLTFGDERCVPPDDERSNYKMAQDSLLSRITIPPENVLRMKGEIDPVVAARQYEDALRARAGGGVFRHDLILLGMGPDGHTASLFPGTPALHQRDRLVIENYVPRMEMWRITFTYPLIDAARHVCFLIKGSDKDDVLNKVLRGDPAYPSAAIRPQDGKLTWLLGV